MKDNTLKKFIVYSIFTEILYLSFFLIEPLRKALGDQAIVLRNGNLFILIVVILLLLTYLYIKIFPLISSKKVLAKHLISFSLVFNLTLLFIWPIGSSDVFSYIYQSRIFSKHHANPYTATYESFQNDDFYYQISNLWSKDTAIYGPAFLLFSSALTFIGGNNLSLNVYLFKVAFVAINILNILLIHKITRSKVATFLYAFNPLIIFELALNVHYDVILIFLFLLSLLYLFKKSSIRSYLIGWSFLVLSVLTKYFTLPLAPFYFIYAQNTLKPKIEKIKFLLLAPILGFLLIVIFYYPFWEGPQTFGRFSDVLAYINVFSSPGVLILSAVLLSLKVDNFHGLSTAINRIAFILIYLLFLMKALFSKNLQNKYDLLSYFVIISLAFFATSFNWLMPWYLTILVATLSVYVGITKKYSFRIYIYGITFYATMSYLVLR